MLIPEQSNIFLIHCDESISGLVAQFQERSRLTLQAFPTVLSFLEQFEPSIPGCVIADFRSPDGGGWDLLDVTQAEPPGIQLIFVADTMNVSTAVELMKAGVCDVLTRPVTAEGLINSIERALAIDVRHKHEFAAVSATRKHYTMLTPREREVFQLVVSGLPSKGIARVLDRSQKTVEVHRTSIMKKMAARSVVDLVRMGIELHVLDDKSEVSTPKKQPPPHLESGNGGMYRLSPFVEYGVKVPS